MGNETSCEAEISIEPWGGKSGKVWSFKAKRGIKQITIRYGGVIDSIKFKGCSDDPSANDDDYYSAKFGGGGGDRTDKIDIDFPSEYLAGISGTHGSWGGYSDLVTSLKFHTNRAQYGPFGKGSGRPFSFNASEGGAITGFHGRAGDYLDAISVVIKPVCSISHVVAMRERLSLGVDLGVTKPRLLPRNPGPWGCLNGGKVWDDGVFSAVKRVQIHLHSNIGVITALQFLYEKTEGKVSWSSLHGGLGVDILKRVEFNGDSEFLIGVEGFCGAVDGADAIRSLTFITNNGKYGPIGVEIGTYFSSICSMGIEGKVVGFHGRSGAYLNAIGVHTEYF